MPHHQCLTKPFRNIPDPTEYSVGCGEQKDPIGAEPRRAACPASPAERRRTDRLLAVLWALTITSRLDRHGLGA